MPEKIFKIFLVDDHPLVREWLANLINQQGNLAVCGEAEGGSEALQRIGAAAPDLAIIDISLSGGSGLELIKSLKRHYPELLMIVLSMHDEKMYAERAIRAGARGYVMKRETANKLVAAIQRVLDGRLGVSDEIAATFAQKFAKGQFSESESPVELLSNRELEIFRLLGQGLDTRRVADNLRLSIKTVQTYCARIKDKLELSTANELLREAVRWNDMHPY